MKTLFSIFTIVVFATFSYATPTVSYINHDKILADFSIENNISNKKLVTSIYKSVDRSDRKLFKDIITTKSRHAYLIKSELDAIDAPEFLLYLAMVESKLSNKATSGAKAGGMWQFMPTTGKNFGLKIDSYVDERRDPIASTDAAFRYLKHLRGGFDKWYLALMAYNCGEGCMIRAIKSAGSDDLVVLLESPGVPKETKNFIKQIIKYAYIANSSDVRKILAFEKEPSGTKRILVNPGTKLSVVAQNAGVSLANIKDLNVHIKGDRSPKDRKYHLYIPEKKYALYMANLNKNSKSTLVAAKEEFKFDLKKYKVQKGDTLIGISKKFDVEMKEIVSLNNLDTHKILVGDHIVIP